MYVRVASVSNKSESEVDRGPDFRPHPVCQVFCVSLYFILAGIMIPIKIGAVAITIYKIVIVTAPFVIHFPYVYWVPNLLTSFSTLRSHVDNLLYTLRYIKSKPIMCHKKHLHKNVVLKTW